MSRRSTAKAVRQASALIPASNPAALFPALFKDEADYMDIQDLAATIGGLRGRTGAAS